MNKTIVKENILRQLELIVEQNNNLNAYSGKIPIIDLDIIKANIRKLYEQIYDLEKANQAIDHFEQNIIKDNTQEVIAEIKETPEKPLVIVNNQPIIEEIKPIQVSEKEKEEEEEEVHLKVEEVEVIFAPEPKAIIEEKVVEIKEETIKETIKNAEDKQKAAIRTDLFGSSATTIADKYKNETKSVNERIQKSKTDKSIGLKMLHNPIKDLKSAIGINEKFLFINELFKGNMKAYNDSIINLNDSESYDKAFEFLDKLKNDYKWEDDMVAYLTFKDFVERKHFK
jgi:hypothetical protein